MNKYIFKLIITFFLIGCQSIDPLFEENKPKVKESGAYYLDDGPDKNPPENLDKILDAQPKYEALSKRAKTITPETNEGNRRMSPQKNSHI